MIIHLKKLPTEKSVRSSNKYPIKRHREFLLSALITDQYFGLFGILVTKIFPSSLWRNTEGGLYPLSLFKRMNLFRFLVIMFNSLQLQL